MKSPIVVLVAGVALVVTAVGIQAQSGIVSIDNVTNTISPSRLSAGSTHTVSIRYNFLANAPRSESLAPWYASNGFEIYSPDRADWVSFAGARGPLINQLGITAVRYQKHFNFDGTNWVVTGNNGENPAGGSIGPSSRAGFYLATLDVTLADGFEGSVDNNIALTFQFQSRVADEGKTICFDTCGAIAAWEWSNGNEDFPLWDNGLGTDGPRCWEIGACPNMPPQWCNGSTGNVSFPYCTEGSYQLCSSGDPDCYPDLTYSFAPPYDDGNHGAVDPTSGLWTWSGVTVPQTGLLDILFQLSDGGMTSPELFTLHVAVTGTGCDCCTGRVGDANNSGDDEPTIADVSTLIDHLFINRPGLACYREGDVNQSGGLDPYVDDISIADISILIDYLFITGPELGLPNCL